MSAHRVSEGGSYRIQMKVKGVGRIAIASGAQTITEYRKRRACLEKLRDTGKLDILRAIKNRQVTINEVYAADLGGRLGFVLADIVLQRPLRASVIQWLERSAKAAGTRKRYKVAWNVLARSRRIRGHTTIKDLDTIDWQAWANAWSASGAHWNNLRRMVSKFLSDHVGKHHPFRHEIMDAFPRKKERKRLPDLAIDEFWMVANTLPEEFRAVYVTLVSTLMRINELLACTDLNLRHHTRKIAVPGTKTVGSDDTIPVCEALWPYVVSAIPCPFSHWQLWRRWRDACLAVGVPPTTLHDLRHVGAQWLTEAGRSTASVQAMLRHDDPSQTAIYTATVLKQEDAETMGRILARQA